MPAASHAEGKLFIGLVTGGGEVKTGRPTAYDPAFCERVVEFGRQGYSKAMMAAELEVVRQTLDNWARTYPEFLDAMTRARDYSLAWWERQGLEGIWSRDFNANAYRLQMMNRFPADWRDTHQVEFRGAVAKLNLTRWPDELLARVASGEHPMQVLASATEEMRKQLAAGPVAGSGPVEPGDSGEIVVGAGDGSDRAGQDAQALKVDAAEDVPEEA